MTTSTETEAGAPQQSAVEAPAAGGALAEQPKERGNGIFQTLVTSDDDVIGFVAYSLYKQSKLDWMRELEKEHGRKPTESELSSYIIGEGTPRRAATYRYLAETALANWNDKRELAPLSAPREGRPRGVAWFFNYSVVALALAIVVLGLTARLVFGHK